MSCDLFAVLVTYRRRALLPEMIRSVMQQSKRVGTLMVVDNESSPDTRALIEELNDRYGGLLRYIDAEQNLGPAGGWALGIQLTLDMGNDDAWILTLDDNNPPRYCDEVERVFELAVSEHHRDPHVAAAGIVGARFDWGTGLLKRLPDDALSGAVPVDYLGGGLLPMYRTGVLRAAGGFDPRLFFGNVEVEMGLRLRRLDYRLYAHGELWRRRRAESGRLNAHVRPTGICEIHWQKFYRIRNYIYMMRKFGRTDLAVRWAAIQCLVKPCATAFRSPPLACRGFRQALHAAYDGFRGNMGRTLEPTLPVDQHSAGRMTLRGDGRRGTAC